MDRGLQIVECGSGEAFTEPWRIKDRIREDVKQTIQTLGSETITRQEWVYTQPTRIIFGWGTRSSLGDVVSRYGSRAMLVTDATMAGLPTVSEMMAMLGAGASLFSQVRSNPTVGLVDELVSALNDARADVLIALGGGSAIDCAKVAGSVVVQGNRAGDYHTGGKKLDARRLPLIALPTTAGTGSEVTSIAVIDDPQKHVKAPMAHEGFYPDVAIVDPELTVSMPRNITTCTGFDALSHALEGYWSKNHQPICDALALRATSLVFTHLPVVLEDGSSVQSREGMSLAALLAGLAFQVPKNAAVHSCSFALSSIYHQPHGAACAMTLDHFVRFNAHAMGERGTTLAQAAGFADMEALADGVAALKRQAGLPAKLSEIGVTESDLNDLVTASFHALMSNNPREVTHSDLLSIYNNMI